MAINKAPLDKKKQEEQARKFVAEAGAAPPADEAKPKKAQVMITFDPEALKRIDAAARRIGLNRSAWLTVAADEKIKREE